MYKAINYWVFGGFAGEKTPYEFIDWAKEKNLDGVELTVGDCLSIDITEAECKKIAAYAAEKGIGLRSLASGAGWGCCLGTDDENERQQALAFCRKYLQIASWIGAEAILVVPGATRVAWEPTRPVLSYKTVWEKTVQSVNELIPLAEELNQEVLTFYPPQDGEWLLKIDGRDIVKASEKKWIKGINIAFNEKTPQFEQAQRVAEANKTFRDLVRSVQSTWKGQENFIRHELKKRAEDPMARAELIAGLPPNRQKQFSFILENWDHKAELEEKAIEGGAEIRKLAKPCPHRYELVLINK